MCGRVNGMLYKYQKKTETETNGKKKNKINPEQRNSQHTTQQHNEKKKLIIYYYRPR